MTIPVLEECPARLCPPLRDRDLKSGSQRERDRLAYVFRSRAQHDGLGPHVVKARVEGSTSIKSWGAAEGKARQQSMHAAHPRQLRNRAWRFSPREIDDVAWLTFSIILFDPFVPF